MRRVGIIQAVQRALIVPQSALRRRNWPACALCGEDVDSVQIVDEGVKMGYRYVVVQAKHHGSDDAVRIDFLSQHPTPSDWEMAMRTATFFDPEHNDTGFSAVK